MKHNPVIPTIMKRLSNRILLAVMTFVTAGVVSCDSVDDDRIPPLGVYVPFNTQPDWIVYGVTGAGSVKTFIKELREPAGYPWTALSLTGFGGVMLVSDVNGDPRAYDLACPYEAKRDIRIIFDRDLQRARCPKCGSVYDIFTNYGYPFSGPAAEEGYALQRYNVGPGLQGEYMVITR